MNIKRILSSRRSDAMLIEPTATLEVAFEKLASDDTSALIVTEDGERILGIVSSSDIVKYLNAHRKFSANLTIADVMTSNVVGCELSEPLGCVEELMAHHRIRYIPITDAGKICGLVSALDIVTYGQKSAELESKQLRDYVSGV